MMFSLVLVLLACAPSPAAHVKSWQCSRPQPLMSDATQTVKVCEFR